MVIAQAPQTQTATTVVETIAETTTQPATTASQQVTTWVETTLETGETEITQPAAPGAFPFEMWAIGGFGIVAAIGALAFYGISRRKKTA